MRYLFVFKASVLVIRTSDQYTPEDEAAVKAGDLAILRFQGDLYQFQTLDPERMAWKNVAEVVR